MSYKTEAAAAAAPSRRERRYPRYRCNFPVTVGAFLGEKHRKLEGHCKDLSLAGMGLLLGADLPVGEVVSLSFALFGSDGAKSSPSWDISAILRHRRGYHYGFEFLSLTKEQTAQLGRFVTGLERVD
jgi:c-di-GMP-binding flagellar brake protein YcgR